MFIFPSGTQSGYQITRSLRFRGSNAAAYLSKAAVASSTNTLWTYSTWFKRGSLSIVQELFSAATSSTSFDAIYFDVNDKLNFQETNSGSINFQITTAQVFRDPSAWYHIVLIYDSNQATASNRLKLYVNGSQVTSFSSASYPPLAGTSYIAWNGATTNTIGRFAGSSAEYFDGHMAEINFVTGQALTPTSFGEFDSFTGVWEPKKYTGTYGTNGFYLNFKDNSAVTAAAIGKDSSGNGNNWTPTNISLTAGATYDSMIDSPTMGVSATQPVGNYCTLNPVDKTSAAVMGNGNLQVQATGTNVYSFSRGTIGMSSGKWYWECVQTVGTSGPAVGIATAQASNSQPCDSFAWGYINNGNKANNNTTGGVAYGSSYTTNDIIGVAFDADAGSLTFYKNNVSQGVAYTGLTSGPYFPIVYGYSIPSYFNVNFGQRPFTYTPPTGYQALCTSNLPDSTIKNGKLHFEAVARTGFGTSGGTYSGLSFKPDFVWSKTRNILQMPNAIDSVRGVTKVLYPSSTQIEDTFTNFFTSFNSNGYTIGAIDYGTSTTAAEWVWKGGGTAVSNTAGTITSQVSANTTSGFSIVTYTGNGVSGATVGHGLGVAPKMIVLKARDVVDNWYVMHQSTATDQLLALNTTGSATNISSTVNGAISTSTTSTTFTCKAGSTNANNVNTSGKLYVAYCFAEVPGFSKFGSYTGNGSADGPFVYLGFRPKFILTKRTDSSTNGNWEIHDSTRNPSNVANLALIANTTDMDSTQDDMDLLSNGFKIRYNSNNNQTNVSGGTYIYAAFAENPFKNSLAR